MASKLTELAVKRLRTKDTTYTRVVDGELYVRVTPKGKKVWIFRYTPPGGNARLKMSLGEISETNDLAAAKALVAKYTSMIESGIDPANPEHGKIRDPTLQDIFDDFMKKGVDRKGNKLRETTLTGYKQALEKDVLPFLGSMKVCEIRKKHIIPLLDAVVERGSRNQANQVYRRLKRVLAFAASREVIEYSPMANMDPIGETKQGSRELTNAEIKIFWEWKPRSEEALKILRLILITGARPGEVAGMKKSEIDGDWWTIPVERSKTKRPHRVFLTKMAKEFLPKDSFTIPRSAVNQCLRRALTGKGMAKEYEPTLALPYFVPHDLRRTMATGLGALKFSDETINAVQGRVKRGVIAVYNRHDYEKERQTAAEAWCRRLKTITSGVNSNVVPLRRTRKASKAK